VPFAVIIFTFDPFVQPFGDLVLRWGTVALVAVISTAVVVAGLLARRDWLRADDVAFITVGAVPGAIVGGRIGFALMHWSYYGSDPLSLLDPSIGGLELGLAVVGGTISGAYVASLLDAPMGRWFHLAMAPVLFALGAGKLTMVLTGAGQGQPSTASWATAYAGPGPWASLGPAIPSVPSQAIEGIATLAILAVLVVILMFRTFRRRDGQVYFRAILLWALARAAVSTTWRDPVVVAGLNAGGIIAIGIAVGCAVILVGRSVRRPWRGRRTTPVDVAWPDPEAEPGG
jgi:prolipoprotein diacylglyceryltransferase